MKVSVVIPAFNVEKTIGKVCREIGQSKYINEIIVVDNNSTDNTYDIALNHTSKVVKCKSQGLGFAMKCGIEKSTSDIVVKIDGDINNPQKDWIRLLISTLDSDIIFSNGYFYSDYDNFPVGNLVAKPSLKIKYPELSYVKMPLSGQYIFKKSYFNLKILPDNWAFDLAMLLHTHALNKVVGQVDLGLLSDERKKISDYSEMAYELLNYIFNEK